MKPEELAMLLKLINEYGPEVSKIISAMQSKGDKSKPRKQAPRKTDQTEKADEVLSEEEKERKRLALERLKSAHAYDRSKKDRAMQDIFGPSLAVALRSGGKGLSLYNRILPALMQAAANQAGMNINQRQAQALGGLANPMATAAAYRGATNTMIGETLNDALSGAADVIDYNTNTARQDAYDRLQRQYVQDVIDVYGNVNPTNAQQAQQHDILYSTQPSYRSNKK